MADTTGAAVTAPEQSNGKTSEGKAAEVENLIAPSLADLGFEIVRVLLTGSGRGERQVLQIMAERPDGTMTVEDCAEVSRAASALLEVEDPIRGAYVLEVSSPGIDRPLTRLKDFARFAGFEAKLELTMPFEGQRRFRGRLKGVEDDTILLLLDEGERELRVSFADLAKAKLVLTDDLIAASTAQ
ncbi:MAG: ribosome maturation factor RimP [Rhodovibrionaceae bacterium]